MMPETVICGDSRLAEIKIERQRYTVEPRYNEPRYNEDPVLTNNI